MPGQPEFQSNQPKNLMQPIPLPDDALHEISIAIAPLTLEIYYFESVDG